MRPFAIALAGCAALIATTAALAQDPSVPQRGQDADPKLPPQSEQIPDKIRPDENAQGNATLSEKLEKSDGVIKPPSEFETEIKTIPPDPNTNEMPIIKPPDEAK